MMDTLQLEFEECARSARQRKESNCIPFQSRVNSQDSWRRWPASPNFPDRESKQMLKLQVAFRGLLVAMPILVRP